MGCFSAVQKIEFREETSRREGRFGELTEL
jgi:hypothetical protein